MTLLSIADDIAYETSGPNPATIIGNTNQDAQNYLRLINKVGKRLQLSYAWDILTKQHTFTSVALEAQTTATPIPTDFGRFIPETCWDRSTNNLISGPISAVEWQGLKVQTYSSQNKKFRYRGGVFLTSPVLPAGNTIAYEYVNINWCDVAATGTEKTAMTLDTDITIIDEELVTLGAIYEFLLQQDQPWQMAAQAYENRFNTLVDNDAASGNIGVVGDIFAQNTRHFDGTPKASRASYGGDF